MEQESEETILAICKNIAAASEDLTIKFSDKINIEHLLKRHDTGICFVDGKLKYAQAIKNLFKILAEINLDVHRYILQLKMTIKILSNG